MGRSSSAPAAFESGILPFGHYRWKNQLVGFRHYNTIHCRCRRKLTAVDQLQLRDFRDGLERERFARLGYQLRPDDRCRRRIALHSNREPAVRGSNIIGDLVSCAALGGKRPKYYFLMPGRGA